MSDARELQSLEPFREVDLADVEDLCRLSPPVEFVEGHTVFEQGGRSDVALLVVRGRLLVEVDAGGRRTELGSIGPGEIVGERALLEPEATRLATVTAVKPTLCVLLSPDLLESVMDHPAWAALERQMLSTLVKRIGETEQAVHGAWGAAQPGASELEADPPASGHRSLRSRLRSAIRGKS